MAQMSKWLLFGGLMTALIGCRIERPQLRRPGTIEQQRIRATIFDPYGDPNAAPPIEGARPRGYAQPLTESERSRLFRSQWSSF